MLVYLDNSALNRPFDDQTQPRIWLETLALCLILQMAEAGEIEMIKSPVHFLENNQSTLAVRRQWVEHCIHLARNEATLDDTVKSRANDLQRGGLKPLDALHVACAETAGASYFLTCDDRLIRRYAGRIAALNPLDFVLHSNQQKL